jgi:hypothetical protein
VSGVDPSNTAAEMFPDDFGAEVIVIEPLEADAKARAFEPFPLVVSLGTAQQGNGLAPPFELVFASPSGAHELVELADLPLAIMLRAQEGGTHRVTLREVAHNRWWGSTTVDVIGDPAR